MHYKRKQLIKHESLRFLFCERYIRNEKNEGPTGRKYLQMYLTKIFALKYIKSTYTE